MRSCLEDKFHESEKILDKYKNSPKKSHFKLIYICIKFEPEFGVRKLSINCFNIIKKTTGGIYQFLLLLA